MWVGHSHGVTQLRLAVAAVLGAVALSGCGQDIQFSDSIDLEFDLFRQGDDLHTPYVVGADFSICADSARKRQLDGTELASGDPSVFEVGATDVNEDGDQICASVIALEEGPVEILVLDDGDVVASAQLDVRAPSRAELYAAGPVLADRPGESGRTEAPQILEGGTATFLVRYFDGDTQLHGSGALKVESSEELALEPLETIFFEDREWLRISPSEVGAFDVELATPAGPFAELPVVIVADDAIADVAVLGSDESAREAGDPMMVYAQAYDEDDGFIYGVDYEWTLGGEAEPGTGDLFRYDYDPAEREELVARHGDLDAAV
ncbi:MAG: hypothetical protein AAF721_10930, partial [Myxococcota bacterium]